MAVETTHLVVAPEARALGLLATDLLVEGLEIEKRDAEFERYKTALCERLRAKYTRDYLQSDPVIGGFRELRRRVGRSPLELPCSTESLIRFPNRTGGIPSINAVVDVYNCVSLETKLTLGAHDLDRISGNVTLRLARGGERFVPLGRAKPESVGAGEYCYFDDEEVLCRLDYRQADKSKLTPDTTRYLFIIQGNPQTSPEMLELARARLAALLERYGSTRRGRCCVANGRPATSSTAGS